LYPSPLPHTHYGPSSTFEHTFAHYLLYLAGGWSRCHLSPHRCLSTPHVHTVTPTPFALPRRHYCVPRFTGHHVLSCVPPVRVGCYRCVTPLPPSRICLVTVGTLRADAFYTYVVCCYVTRSLILPLFPFVLRPVLVLPFCLRFSAFSFCGYHLFHCLPFTFFQFDLDCYVAVPTGCSLPLLHVALLFVTTARY